jgi:hypothetical protein
MSKTEWASDCVYRRYDNMIHGASLFCQQPCLGGTAAAAAPTRNTRDLPTLSCCPASTRHRLLLFVVLLLLLVLVLVLGMP